MKCPTVPKCLTTPLPFTPTSGNAKHTMQAHSHKHTFHRAESVTCRAVCEWAAASCAHLSESQPSPAAERGRKSFSKWISLVESNVICFHTYFSVAYLLQYKLKKVSDFFFLSKSFKNLVALNLSEILLKESTRAMRDTNLKVVVLTTRKYSSSFLTVLHCSVSFFISMFYLDKKKNFAEFGLIINHQQCWDFVCAAVNHVAPAGEICHNLSDFPLLYIKRGIIDFNTLTRVYQSLLACGKWNV